MVPLADAVPMVSPADGLDSVTAKPSSASTVVSPAARIVIVFEVWPTANVTVPEGNTPVAKSDALAACNPLPATDQSTDWLEAEAWPSVTVKVKDVVPLLPSALTASRAAIETDASSLRMVPLADAVPIVRPADGPDSVTAKPSS